MPAPASPRRRRGATLLELLLVLAVVAVLVALSVPRFEAMRRRALGASFRADLVALRDAQEGFFAEHRRYATTLSELGFQPATPGVRIDLSAADPAVGWQAQASAPYSPQSGSCMLTGGIEGATGGSGVQCNSYVFGTAAKER
jgi:prepilin-type N-terminal cleavage/methylation domain-containing protein